MDTACVLNPVTASTYASISSFLLSIIFNKLSCSTVVYTVQVFILITNRNLLDDSECEYRTVGQL
jgi:hypothetical protein